MDLHNKLAIVTGATKGIGRAIAFALGRAGARVAICARTARDVQATVAALRDAGVDAIGRACDVSDPAAVRAFADAVGRERGDAAVLVNNAGIGRMAPLESLTLEDWDLTMAVNLRSLYLVTRAFLPGLLNTGESSVVNIASLAGRNGFEGGTAYCASKHAVLGFSKALMFEVRKRGVRVIAICPGTVDTSFGDERHVRRTRSDRALQSEDVAQTVLATLGLPARAMVSELDMRPSNP